MRALRLGRSHLWILIPVCVIAFALFAAWVIVRPSLQQSSLSPTTSIECTDSYAENFNCWRDHYNTIVASQSPEAAFKDFRKNYESNEFVKSNCHQIAHVIGRAAAKKYTTLTETYSHGDNFCWSGYYHGAIETIAQQLGPKKILEQINTVCADYLKNKPYSFDHYNCVHGMGHGLMAVQDNNLFTALKSCDAFDGPWQQESCYGGVFMENVMNEINPGEHSNYLKNDEPLYPCTAVEDRYKEQCYLMQTSHALKVVSYDYNKVFGLCGTVTAPYDATCYQSLGRDISGQSSSSASRTVELCMQGPTFAARDNCFSGAVKDFISYFHSDTQGLNMCAQIPDQALSSSCSNTGKAYYKTF